MQGTRVSVKSTHLEIALDKGRSGYRVNVTGLTSYRNHTVYIMIHYSWRDRIGGKLLRGVGG